MNDCWLILHNKVQRATACALGLGAACYCAMQPWRHAAENTASSGCGCSESPPATAHPCRQCSRLLQVYNVTEYLDEHPGGGEVMLSVAGKDATNDFEDVGHSTHARSMLDKYIVGAFSGGESSRPARKVISSDASSSAGAGLLRLLQFLLPLVAIGLAVLAYSLKKE